MNKNNFASSVLFILSLVVFLGGLILGAFFIFALQIAIIIWILTVIFWALLYGVAELLGLLQSISDDLKSTQLRLNAIEHPHKESDVTDEEPSAILIIHGYTESYLDNPDVIVSIDGEILGNLKHKGTLEIDIKKDCDLQFSMMMKQKEIHVIKGQTTTLQVSMAYKTLSVKDSSEKQ
jgi:predicted membrane protein